MQDDREKDKDGMRAYAKYSGLASQMIASILLLSLLGYWLDKYFQTSKPYFTAALCVFGVFSGMYLIIRQLPK